MDKENKKRISKILFLEFFWGFIYFPIWWYSYGLYNSFKFSTKKIVEAWHNYGLGIGFKYLFEPMYSQNDFWGRVISFFMRIVVLIFKFIIFCIYFSFYIVLFIAWILFPIFVCRFIYLNIKFLI